MAKEAKSFTRAVEVRKTEGGYEFQSSENDAIPLEEGPLSVGVAMNRTEPNPDDPEKPTVHQVGNVESVTELKGWAPWTHALAVKTVKGSKLYFVH